MVQVAHPRHLRTEVERHIALVWPTEAQGHIGCDRGQVALRGLPLIGIGGRIERVGAKVIDGRTRLRRKGEGAVVVGQLAKPLRTPEIAVRHGAVRPPSAPAHRGMEATLAAGIVGVHGLAQHGGITASSHFGLDRMGRCASGIAGRSIGACDDVDGTAEGLAAKHTRGSAFENLDALNVGKVDGEIGRVVARVGIADGYAVNKDGNLVVRTAVDANVRLHTKAAALSDINADG